jgi:vacuolar protein sorting-associated protein 13A/C
VSNITGGLAGSVSLISGDAEYMAQRGQMNKKKAKGVVQGIGLGAKSLFMGVSQGISGVVTQPVKEAKKRGLKGFFKGMAKGVGGLVSKPVVGVLDSVSKTTEVNSPITSKRA